jgi:hypothetical protein
MTERMSVRRLPPPGFAGAAQPTMQGCRSYMARAAAEGDPQDSPPRSAHKFLRDLADLDLDRF